MRTSASGAGGAETPGTERCREQGRNRGNAKHDDAQRAQCGLDVSSVNRLVVVGVEVGQRYAVQDRGVTIELDPNLRRPSGLDPVAKRDRHEILVELQRVAGSPFGADAHERSRPVGDRQRPEDLLHLVDRRVGSGRPTLARRFDHHRKRLFLAIIHKVLAGEGRRQRNRQREQQPAGRTGR